ncbi:glycosyltransferase [Romeria aff. gracilis LEGE 07310]|uniref:Glycosyltransferase n=1 Tax=Vasconcelosia minhoensis LEGE 07310 TaxID=915328 RepID=A0A8J7AQV7_9CYAN|nr:glycosyltransferase [Romeria gracilis]MBE9078736.1 glycosyltransferase [Romeria aff. gracilis LEGE 07310]
MNQPLLSIIIPTHNRPQLLQFAVESALAQTVSNIEVVVVDDASAEPLQLPDDPRLRLIRLEASRGGAGARNVGTEAARGRWVTYLDDDDDLLPSMAEVSLQALQASSLETPVAVISGLEKITPEGKLLKVRIPPNLSPKGSYFFLEPPEPNSSYASKQTLVVERSVMLNIGGWDENFRSRVHSELFLRLNPVCNIIGIPTITYRHVSHHSDRVSSNPQLRQESFHRLIQKHYAAFAAHPRQFSRFVYRHGQISLEQGQLQAAAKAFLWAMKIEPVSTFQRLTAELKTGLKLQVRRLLPVSP